MSIRITLCCLYVLVFSIYAWRNWFISLCSALLLTAVIQHPDMPKSIGGIQGLNLWNILMLNVLLAWWFNRSREGMVWDMPRSIMVLLSAYLAVVVVAFLRLLTAPSTWGDASFGYIVSEHLVNCVKWVLPGLILFDGCRTPRRINIALISLLGLYVLLAIQVIRWMPLSYAVSGDELSARASKIVQNEIGYNRVTLSMMLGGASWAILSTLVRARTWLQKLGILGASGLVALGQALTGGRMGYVSWVLVGLLLCLVRWRRLLVVIPIAILAVSLFLPGVWERMLQGFESRSGNVVIQTDDYEITSGRTLAWPHVIRKIGQAPILGYGRLGMVTTGLKDWLWEEYYESFPHPHNAYLELLLDNGLVGFFMVIPFYLVVFWRGLGLLVDRRDALVCAAGGVGVSLVAALLIGGMGGQTFYPREGAVGMWAAIGFMMRVYVDRLHARMRSAEEPPAPSEAWAVG